MTSFATFGPAVDYAINTLSSQGYVVDTGRWQGIATEGRPDLRTKEIRNLQFEVSLERGSWYEDGEEEYAREIAGELNPNLPWADLHFDERIGGIPRNPDPSHTEWPWWHGQDDQTKDRGQFTHTYSERFWPTVDGHPAGPNPRGIRFRYGDYNDLVDLLMREPYTRQAYLPIFFPEDTGAVHLGRTPCSLGYHFMLRDGRFHIWYDIRSCDAVRHFRDDLYLAARLAIHTLTKLFESELRSTYKQVWVDVNPGSLYFCCHSFHVHMGDIHRI